MRHDSGRGTRTVSRSENLSRTAEHRLADCFPVQEAHRLAASARRPDGRKPLNSYPERPKPISSARKAAVPGFPLRSPPEPCSPVVGLENGQGQIGKEGAILVVFDRPYRLIDEPITRDLWWETWEAAHGRWADRGSQMAVTNVQPKAVHSAGLLRFHLRRTWSAWRSAGSEPHTRLPPRSTLKK